MTIIFGSLGVFAVALLGGVTWYALSQPSPTPSLADAGDSGTEALASERKAENGEGTPRSNTVPKQHTRTSTEAKTSAKSEQIAAPPRSKKHRVPQPGFDIEPFFRIVGWNTGARSAPVRLLKLLRKRPNDSDAKFGLIDDQIVFSANFKGVGKTLEFVETHHEQLKFKKSPSPRAVKKALGEPENVQAGSLQTPDLRSISCEYWTYYGESVELVFRRGSTGPQELIGWRIDASKVKRLHVVNETRVTSNRVPSIEAAIALVGTWKIDYNYFGYLGGSIFLGHKPGDSRVPEAEWVVSADSIRHRIRVPTEMTLTSLTGPKAVKEKDADGTLWLSLEYHFTVATNVIPYTIDLSWNDDEGTARSSRGIWRIKDEKLWLLMSLGDERPNNFNDSNRITKATRSN